MVSIIGSGAGSVARIGPPDLAEDRFHLREGHDDLVGLLQQLLGVGDGDPGNVVGMYSRSPSQRGGMNSDPIRLRGINVEATSTAAARTTSQRRRRASVEQRRVTRPAGCGRSGCCSSLRMWPRTNQNMRTGITVTATSDAMAIEYGLREGERLEEPPLLRLQGEDRHEGNGDHEQAEEERRADLLRRPQDDLEMGALAPPLLVVLVGVLHHDDRRVHQHADRDRDAAERHDVGAEPLDLHHDEGEQDRQRDREDRHEGGAEMEEEERGRPGPR